MYIESNVKDASSLVYGGKSYKVVDGIADVPVEVRNEVIKFRHWQDVSREVDKKIQDALSEPKKGKKSAKDE